MKKKNLFMVAIGALLLSVGLTSCKKDKGKDCVELTYSYYGETYTDCFCVDDYTSRAAFEKEISYMQKEYKAKVKYVDSCRD